MYSKSWHNPTRVAGAEAQMHRQVGTRLGGCELNQHRGLSGIGRWAAVALLLLWVLWFSGSVV